MVFINYQSINNNDLFIGEFMISFSNIYSVWFLQTGNNFFFLRNFLDEKENESDFKAKFTTPTNSQN